MNKYGNYFLTFQGRFALPKFSAIGSKLGEGCALPPTSCIPNFPYR